MEHGVASNAGLPNCISMHMYSRSDWCNSHCKLGLMRRTQEASKYNEYTCYFAAELYDIRNYATICNYKVTVITIITTIRN